MVYLQQEFLRLKRGGGCFSLAMVDIDAFSIHNQRLGALNADRVLWKAARVITGRIRNVDIASRYGGDRFAVVFVASGLEDALKAAERIRVGMEDESKGQVTVSIGLSAAEPGSNGSMDQIIREAESALAQAKIKGRNRVCGFEPARTVCSDIQPRILLVDDEPLNLKFIEGLLKPLGYITHKAQSGKEALYILGKTEIDLLLLDIMMPEMDGFAVCSAVKASEDTRMTPVILITALDDIETKVRGIEAGADDFITKPPNKLELIARVKSLLRLKRLNQNLTSIENVLFSMAKTVEAKDSYTQGHVDRVSEIAIRLGKRMGLGTNELEALRFGGALHDIGKLGVPEEILNKPGPLDEAEWAVMKTHPEIGYRICLPLKRNLRQALDIVRHHHEKMDGSGYPDGLKQDDIPMVTRIMAVADIYDALVTDRPYRKAMPRQRALQILLKEAGEGKLDRSVIQCLLLAASEKKRPGN